MKVLFCGGVSDGETLEIPVPLPDVFKVTSPLQIQSSGIYAVEASPIIDVFRYVLMQVVASDGSPAPVPIYCAEERKHEFGGLLNGKPVWFTT